MQTTSTVHIVLGNVERKSAFKHVQDAQIQIILLSIHTFYSIQWFC